MTRYCEEEIVIEELESAPDEPRKFWSVKEEAILKKYYLKKGARPIADYLGRTVRSVRCKAEAMGLRRKVRDESNEDDDNG